MNELKIGSQACITKSGPEAFGFGIFEKGYPNTRRVWVIARSP
jgi:hypothetical protein